MGFKNTTVYIDSTILCNEHAKLLSLDISAPYVNYTA